MVGKRKGWRLRHFSIPYKGVILKDPKVYCSMRSLEEALMDTIAEPEFLHAALDHIAEAQGEMVRHDSLLWCEGVLPHRRRI